MKKTIVLIVTAALLIGVITDLAYQKELSEPKSYVSVHKALHAKKVITPIKPVINVNAAPVITITNEKEYPYFEEYKNSVMPFITSQYPTGSKVSITLSKVIINNWKMQIFYNATGENINKIPFKQTDLNYSTVVRANIPIPSITSYQKTDSAMVGNHYTIPAGTSYLTVNVDGQQHVQFLVHGSGVCNDTPDISNNLDFTNTNSEDTFDSNSSVQTAPDIYSIIDTEAIGNTGYFNPNSASLKYDLVPTQVEKINQYVNVPAKSVMYYYPSKFAKPIVTTNKTLNAIATAKLRTSGQYTMYLVSVQGQEGWVKINN